MADMADDKLYNVTVHVSVSVYAHSEHEAIAGVKEAINKGLLSDYDTEAEGFYSATAEVLESA